MPATGDARGAVPVVGVDIGEEVEIATRVLKHRGVFGLGGRDGRDADGRIGSVQWQLGQSSE